MGLFTSFGAVVNTTYMHVVMCVAGPCTPDDGRVYRPKHVEWTRREINLTAHCCICWSFRRIRKNCSIKSIFFFFAVYAKRLKCCLWWRYPFPTRTVDVKDTLVVNQYFTHLRSCNCLLELGQLMRHGYYATDLTNEESYFERRQNLEIISPSKVSEGPFPSPPPIQWTPEANSPRVKRS